MNTQRVFTLLLVAAVGAALSSHCLAGNSSDPRIVAKVGDPVPGVMGATFSGFNAPVINNAGEVAFQATITGGSVTTATNTAIFAGPPNAPVIRVREGDTSPVAGGTFFFLDPRIMLADDGNLFYAAQLAGSPVTAANDRVLIVNGGAGNDTVLLREGDSLGGTRSVAATGLNFEPRSGVMLANRDGHAGVVAGMTDSLSPGLAQFAVLHLNAGDGNDVIAVSNSQAPEGLGTFVPEFTGANPFELLGVGPLGGTTFRGSGEGDGAKPFDAFFHYDPFTNSTGVVVKTGDKATGAKPGRVFSVFQDPAVTGGGLVIFPAVFQKGADGEVIFNEVGLFTKYAKYKAALEALRDRSAKKTGGVFAGFSAPVVNQNGVTAFLADLFKRPDGFPAGQGQGAFGGPGKPLLIAQSGKPVPGLPDTTVTGFSFDGPIVTNGGEVFTPCTVDPGLSTILRSSFRGGPPITDIFLQDGLSVPVGAGNDTINLFDFPFGGTTSSEGKPRTVNDLGSAVIECVFATNGNSVYFTGTPKAPPEALQPDIILNETEKVGDDVHQKDPAPPQKVDREQPVNAEVFYPFFIQNDGTALDTINFKSGGSGDRDIFKWYEGDDTTTEISEEVFGAGREYVLAPGDKVRVRLSANRQTLENKGKEKTIKMKATSTIDKKFRDTFSITIKFNPVP